MVLDSAKARQRIENVEDLPTLPPVAGEIIKMASDPKVSASDVGELISRDQALTAKVLKIVNSSFYGFPQRIKTINHAIVILGFNKVKNVVLGASVFDMGKSVGPGGPDFLAFWEHSLGVAIGASVVAKHMKQQAISPDDAFVGGLLHDVGKVICWLVLKNDYAEVLQAALDRKMLLRDAEKELLGFHHSQVGIWLAEKWKLPPHLIAAVRYHHQPGAAGQHSEIAHAVHCGDILIRALGIGNGLDRLIPAFDNASVDQLGINDTYLSEVFDELIQELKNAEEFFRLIRQ